MKQYIIMYVLSLVCLGFTYGQSTSNTSFGSFTGTGGSMNSFFGYSAGYGISSGVRNVFLGYYAGWENGSGNENVYIGSNSGRVTYTGSSNTMVGTETGNYNDSGSFNAVFGANSGNSIYSGSYNTFLGANSGYNNYNGQRNVFIGSYAGYNETGSDKLYIDNSNTSSPLIYGDFLSNKLIINGILGIGTTTPDSGSLLRLNTKSCGVCKNSRPLVSKKDLCQLPQ